MSLRPCRGLTGMAVLVVVTSAVYPHVPSGGGDSHAPDAKVVYALAGAVSPPSVAAATTLAAATTRAGTAPEARVATSAGASRVLGGWHWAAPVAPDSVACSRPPATATTALSGASMTTEPPRATDRSCPDVFVLPDDRFASTALGAAAGGARAAVITGADHRVGAVGDSIMLAAAPRLTAIAGWDVHVDAKVGRQFAAGIGGLATFADAGMPVLVLHLGTNGPVTDALFDRAMAAAGATPRVIVLTVQLPDVPRYAYEAGTNDVLRRGTVRYGAVLVDWHAATEGRRDVLRRDGIHLTAAGEELYASLVAAAL